jgi:hypothetical protein
VKIEKEGNESPKKENGNRVTYNANEKISKPNGNGESGHNV